MKKCLGFKEHGCYLCKRLDQKAESRLIEKLSHDPDTGEMFCNHWIRLSAPIDQYDSTSPSKQPDYFD